MTQREVLVVGCARTAIGTYGGTLKDVPLSDITTIAVRAALERSGVAPAEVGQVVIGNVIPTEPRDAYLSRVASMDAGIPKETPTFNVNRLCEKESRISRFSIACPAWALNSSTQTKAWSPASQRPAAPHTGSGSGPTPGACADGSRGRTRAVSARGARRSAAPRPPIRRRRDARSLDDPPRCAAG